MPQANNAVEAPTAEETPEARRRRLDLRMRAINLDLDLDRREVGSTDAGTSTFQASENILANRATLADETESPTLVGIGKFFTDANTGLRQRGVILGEMARVATAGRENIEGNPNLKADQVEAQQEFIRLSKESQDNQELFNILKQRRPEAGRAELFSWLGASLIVPGKKVPGGNANLLRGQTTVGTEAASGTLLGSSIPVTDPETGLFTTVAGLVIGPTIFGLGRGFSNTGRNFIGGSPAAIENTADLLAAEKNLGVVGLLTTGEIRSGGILPRIEGLFDNLPIPLLGFSGHREIQRQGFQNAINHMRSAFPNMTEAQALRSVRFEMNKNATINAAMYRRVALSVPENAPMVRPTHYVQEAERLRLQEVAKGDRASQATLRYLEEQSAVTAVPFTAAQAISSDLKTTARVAARQAEDPMKTGINAGAAKKLVAAHMRDLEVWAQEVGGETHRLWRAASDDFVNNVLPFGKRPLAPLFDGNEFDSATLVKALMKPENARQLSKLDKDNAMTFLYLHDSIRRTTKAGHVDVRALARLLDNAEGNRAASEYVSDETREMITGFVRLVDAAPRAFISPKAARIIGTTVGTAAVVGGAAAFDDGAGIAAGVSLGAMRFLVGTTAGRAILTSAARVNPNARDALAAMALNAGQASNRCISAATSNTFRNVEVPLPSQQAEQNVQPVQ